MTDGEELMIVIEDNGVGMEEQALKSLLKRIHSKDRTGSHVGLGNVQERLELDGGEDYGIVKMESRAGENFKVYLKIKKGKKYV